MRESTKRKSSGNIITVNFRGVETGGRKWNDVHEGRYELKVVEITREESEKGNEYLSWEFEVISDQQKGAKVWHNTSLQKQALWNLRGLLEALGIDVPDDEIDIDIDDMIDRTVGAEILLEEYNGKKKPSIADFFEFTDESKEEPEEEKPRKGRKSSDEEDDDGDSRASRRAERRKARKEKKKTLYSADAVMSMSEDELEDLIGETDLDVDLDDYKTLKLQRNAVVNALEEAGLLDEEA